MYDARIEIVARGCKDEYLTVLEVLHLELRLPLRSRYAFTAFCLPDVGFASLPLYLHLNLHLS